MSCINVTENMNASTLPLSKGCWLTSNMQIVVIKREEPQCHMCWMKARFSSATCQTYTHSQDIRRMKLTWFNRDICTACSRQSATDSSLFQSWRGTAALGSHQAIKASLCWRKKKVNLKFGNGKLPLNLSRSPIWTLNAVSSLSKCTNEVSSSKLPRMNDKRSPAQSFLFTQVLRWGRQL